MFAAILAALSNPAVDAALVQAASSLVNYIASLSEQDRQKIIAQVDAAAKSSGAQLAAFDADLAITRAHLDALQKAADDRDHATINALVAQIRERVEAPWPAAVAAVGGKPLQ